jgi:MFS family permease
VHPFQTPRRGASPPCSPIYFAQGMYGLPDQAITIGFKEQAGRHRVAEFFLLASIPWFVKPFYGLICDFFPLFGQRRKSYLLLTSALACTAGLIAGLSMQQGYWWLAILYTTMGLGLAFNDVLTDALMVERGKPLGLMGAFQSVQWPRSPVRRSWSGCWGALAERRDLYSRSPSPPYSL